MKKTLLAVATAGAVLLTPLEAGAHFYDATSNVSISYSERSFKGTVNSSRAFCMGNRRVTLYKRVDGQPDPVVGTDTTNHNGFWSISKPGANGRYYVKVSSKVRSGEFHNHVCRSTASGLVRA